MTMLRDMLRLCLVFTLMWTPPSYALDSYRFLHVTIETPWLIFIFLLGAIFAPFVLMAVLVWRYTERRPEGEEGDTGQSVGEKQ